MINLWLNIISWLYYRTLSRLSHSMDVCPTDGAVHPNGVTTGEVCLEGVSFLAGLFCPVVLGFTFSIFGCLLLVPSSIENSDGDCRIEKHRCTIEKGLLRKTTCTFHQNPLQLQLAYMEVYMFFSPKTLSGIFCVKFVIWWNFYESNKKYYYFKIHYSVQCANPLSDFCGSIWQICKPE